MSKRTIGFLTGRDEEERVDPTYKEPRSRTPSSGKRAKGASSAAPSDAFDLGEEFVCPITQEFPLDPVMLADGKSYERSAINEHIRRNGHDGVVRSPVTNLEVCAQLIPAHLVRNTLAHLINQGVIKGERADTWKAATKKIEEDSRHHQYIKKLTKEGNIEAMEELGNAYELGDWGLKKDLTVAHALFLRAGRGGSAGSLTRAAICYLNGTGVPRSAVRGMCLAHEAATMGSEHACSLIAMGYDAGRWGLDEDKAEAVYWYRRAKKASVTDTPEECRKRAIGFLASYGHMVRAVDTALLFLDSDEHIN